MKVKDAMHPGVICVEPDTPIRDVARTMKQEDVGAIPVKSDGELVGMITDRDLACRALCDGLDVATLRARDVMTRGAICCLAGDDISDALGVMEGQKIRRLPVMDRDGALVGMLSLGDISRGVSDKVSGEVLKSVTAHHR
ncbi:CBS domain-containing protein [Phenylobacterium soli]|uniref:CBS domain-containing protein n=1 Tax=Phenylobacterium soli TaxID=2170551 RepID=A0A328AP68_9CAUL|nr:CBS domain-containing protein [Phenylobacterium soli]RAK56377.1 CBS domain-containing protein [Phenylobacterium soli]